MDKGTVVYLCWYDFASKREDVYQGEVVDNDLWADTQWAGWVNVQFTPRGLTKPICHHFRKEQLSLDAQNVPHDDCYLVCGQKQKKQEPQRERKAEYEAVSLEDFKKLHWNHERNHLQTDSLEAFYRLWRHRVAIRAGIQKVAKEMTYPVIHQEYPSTPAEAKKKLTTYDIVNMKTSKKNEQEQKISAPAKGAKVSDTFKTTIKAYLDKRAAEDELFAKTYAKENKNIDECCNYILQQVQKSGCMGFTDEEIYGMAIHYYDEDDIKNVKPVSAGKIVVNHVVERPVAQQTMNKGDNKKTEQAKTKEDAKPARKLSAKKRSTGRIVYQNAIQTSIFDM